jgi:hypothetical protein
MEPKFTYTGYFELVNYLLSFGFETSFFNELHNRPLYIRHDVDYSLDKALMLAKLENQHNIKSTYFILISSDFYNIYSKRTKRILTEINSLGHQIGLQFDQTSYDYTIDIQTQIIDEINILENASNIKLHSFSFHRPRGIKDLGEIKIENLVNVYSKGFFDNIFYISDSRNSYRTNPYNFTYYDFTRNRGIQLLTHAEWYFDNELSIKNKIDEFINSVIKNAWVFLDDNITDLESLYNEEDIK